MLVHDVLRDEGMAKTEAHTRSGHDGSLYLHDHLPHYNFVGLLAEDHTWGALDCDKCLGLSLEVLDYLWQCHKFVSALHRLCPPALLAHDGFCDRPWGTKGK